jgi:hypothetical protein
MHCGNARRRSCIGRVDQSELSAESGESRSALLFRYPGLPKLHGSHDAAIGSNPKPTGTMGILIQFPALLGGAVLLILGLTGCDSEKSRVSTVVAAAACVQAIGMGASDCSRWPPPGLNEDGWGRRLRCVIVRPGVPAIVSNGRDGTPRGSGPDADIVCTSRGPGQQCSCSVGSGY